jgi:hypothetical protein
MRISIGERAVLIYNRRMNFDNPFGDLLPGLPHGDLQSWAFNPFHPTAIKVVTATIAGTSLIYLLCGFLAR